MSGVMSGLRRRITEEQPAGRSRQSTARTHGESSLGRRDHAGNRNRNRRRKTGRCTDDQYFRRRPMSSIRSPRAVVAESCRQRLDEIGRGRTLEDCCGYDDDADGCHGNGRKNSDVTDDVSVEFGCVIAVGPVTDEVEH